MVTDIQYGCVTPSVQRRHIIQYGVGCTMRWRAAVRICHIISMEVSHLQYSGGCALWTCHIISTEEDVQYRANKTAQGVIGGGIYLGKMVFYRQSYQNLDFILLMLSPDVGEIPLGC